MNIEHKLTQPLTLDIKAFKKRYSSMIGLSSFERANKLATESKRAAWAAYRPLSLAQLYNSLDETSVDTILVPQDQHKAPARSTLHGALYAQIRVVLRPTEILATLHALGLYKFDSEDPVIRQDPNKKVWWCITCKTFKPLEMFAKDRRTPTGLAFCCNRCRKDNERSIFKRAA